mgnify:CR=1 FL=1
MSCFIVIDYLERKYKMGIKVDSRLTQTENLNRLLEEAGIGIERRRDFESISIIEENRVVKGKQYNTQLQMHLIHGSPTHRKEKKTFATTVYNRMPVGWNNDTGFTFTYDETKNKVLNRDRGDADLKLLATIVNNNPNLSHDPKYPFRVTVNEEYTELEVIPHLASPCYYGRKRYPLNIIIDQTNEPIFEDDVYYISALGVPGAQLINSGVKETTRITLMDKGVSKEVTAVVIPYKQRVEGKVYQHSFVNSDEIYKANPSERIGKRVSLQDPETKEYANALTTLLGIGRPYRDQPFSFNKKENLKRITGESDIATLVDRNIIENSEDNDIHSPIIMRCNKVKLTGNNRDYHFNILQTTRIAIILKYLDDYNTNDSIRKENGRYIYRTNDAYRSIFPEDEEIVFKIRPSGTSGLYMDLMIYGVSFKGNFAKATLLLAAIRAHIADKLSNDGVTDEDISYLLGSSPYYDNSLNQEKGYHIVKDQWLIDDQDYKDNKRGIARIQSSDHEGVIPNNRSIHKFNESHYFFGDTRLYISFVVK